MRSETEFVDSDSDSITSLLSCPPDVTRLSALSQMDTLDLNDEEMTSLYEAVPLE